VLGVLFTYKNERYGIRFGNEGERWLADGTVDPSGRVDFLWNGDTVLGVGVFLESGEFGKWCWRDVHVFKIGEWATKAPRSKGRARTTQLSALRVSACDDRLEN
jgi:hypothetical protein